MQEKDIHVEKLTQEEIFSLLDKFRETNEIILYIEDGGLGATLYNDIVANIVHIDIEKRNNYGVKDCIMSAELFKNELYITCLLQYKLSDIKKMLENIKAVVEG